MQALHQRFPTNPSGRDFVVGDLHGCLDLLQAQLERVGFDTGCGRLFSVGDLVDRGPDSMGCLRLLREPWFHAVRGNHEDMLLDYAYGRKASTCLLRLDHREVIAWLREAGFDADGEDNAS